MFYNFELFIFCSFQYSRPTTTELWWTYGSLFGINIAQHCTKICCNTYYRLLVACICFFLFTNMYYDYLIIIKPDQHGIITTYYDVSCSYLLLMSRLHNMHTVTFPSFILSSSALINLKVLRSAYQNMVSWMVFNLEMEERSYISSATYIVTHMDRVACRITLSLIRELPRSFPTVHGQIESLRG